jgi:hypothetical protein
MHCLLNWFTFAQKAAANRATDVVAENVESLAAASSEGYQAQY